MQHDQIVGGDHDSALEHLYRAWQTDIDNGLQSIMIAADNATVRTLNARAQAQRIARGEVSSSGIETGSGTKIGQGDRIVTRRNDRTLASGTAWVKNGDQWVVTKVRRDGSCLVSRAGGGANVLLPTAYVREHVDLAYATNAHRAQGSTVDTSHAFIAATTQRELLYVMATRGRQSNRLYVDTKYDPDIDTLHGPIEERSAIDVLTGVLAREGADRSATETIRSTWEEATSINRLWAEYETIAAAERIAKTHIAGNSLGGWMAIELARRGRALSVCALSPAGFWTSGDSDEGHATNTLVRLRRLGRVGLPLAHSPCAVRGCDASHCARSPRTAKGSRPSSPSPRSTT